MGLIEFPLSNINVAGLPEPWWSELKNSVDVAQLALTLQEMVQLAPLIRRLPYEKLLERVRKKHPVGIPGIQNKLSFILKVLGQKQGSSGC